MQVTNDVNVIFGVATSASGPVTVHDFIAITNHGDKLQARWPASRHEPHSEFNLFLYHLVSLDLAFLIHIMQDHLILWPIEREQET